MDDVTKAALEIAVEQLEEAERIIEALTEENVRLKQEAMVDPSKWRFTGYPHTQVTSWNAPASSSTVTHMGLYSSATAANNASTEIVNLTTATKDFKESLERLRKRYEEMVIEPGTEENSYRVDTV